MKTTGKERRHWSYFYSIFENFTAYCQNHKRLFPVAHTQLSWRSMNSHLVHSLYWNKVHLETSVTVPSSSPPIPHPAAYYFAHMLLILRQAFSIWNYNGWGLSFKWQYLVNHANWRIVCISITSVPLDLSAARWHIFIQSFTFCVYQGASLVNTYFSMWITIYGNKSVVIRCRLEFLAILYLFYSVANRTMHSWSLIGLLHR